MFDLDFFIIIGFFLATLFYGLWCGRGVKNMADYSVGHRRFGTAVMVATIAATLIGGGSTIGAAAKYYTVGIIFLLGPIFEASQYLIVAKWIAPRMARFKGMISIGDIMHHLYGKRGRVVVGIFGAGLTVGILGAQIVGMGYVLNYFFDISKAQGVLLGASVIVFYATFGGVRSVVATDVVQFAVLIVAIPIACSVAVEMVGGYQGVMEAIPRERLSFFPTSEIAWTYWPIFLSYIMPVLTPPIIQRLLMSGDTRQLSASFRNAALLKIPFGIVVALIGFAGLALFPDIEPHTIMPHLVDTVMPMGLKGLVVCGMLAVIMSTADSELNSGAVLLVHDVTKPVLGIELSDRSELRLTQIFTVLMGILAVSVALSGDVIFDIVRMSFNFWGPIIPVPLLMGIMGYIPSKRAFLAASISAGLLVTVWNLNLEAIGFEGFFPALALDILLLLVIDRRNLRRLPRYESVSEKPPTPPKPRQFGLKAIRNFAEARVKEHGAQYIRFGVFGLVIFVFLLMSSYGVESVEFTEVSFLLRFMASMLCFLLIMQGYWRRGLRKWLPLYWHFTLLFCLPFLGSFFVLMSGGDIPYYIYAVISILVLFVLVDWLSFTILCPLGVGLAWGVFYCLGERYNLNTPHETVVWAGLLLFIMMALGLLFTRNKAKFDEDKLKSMYSLGGAIAHEMRTPLSAMSALGVVVEGLMPKIKSGQLKPEEYKRLESVLDNFSATQKNAFSVIDMLLTKLEASHTRGDSEAIQMSSMVNHALSTYAFIGNDRRLITFNEDNDFEFFGSELLMKHVLFNLIKNAVHYVKKVGKGEITIWMEQEGDSNILHFRDTGSGVDPSDLPYIFQRFFSKTKHGTGVGLSFCQRVMEDLGGEIFCESVLGEFTEFVLVFPLLDEE